MKSSAWTLEKLEQERPVPISANTPLWVDWSVARLLEGVPGELVSSVAAKHLGDEKARQVMAEASSRSNLPHATAAAQEAAAWRKSIGSALAVVGAALFLLMLPHLRPGIPGLLGVVGLGVLVVGLRIYLGRRK